ncbi:MAG: hypothetical protein LBU66_03970 [Treponema sp.]|jgi:hypothetical protein|nr:hypothetical protein [Treponema sp.]
MKKYILYIFLIIIVLSSCVNKLEKDETPEEPETTVYHLPHPQRVYFYRDGTIVYDATVPVSSIADNKFILPDNIDTNSFSIFQEDSRIFSYSLETTVLPVQLLDQNPDEPGKPLVVENRVLLVTVPDIKPGLPLDVRFGVGRSGITWDLVLDMEARPNNTLECNLLASISTVSLFDSNLESILAKKPEIILLPSRNVFLEGSDSIFNLGNILIETNKVSFIKLDDGQSTYRLVYRWDPNQRERPGAYLYCTNPFNFSLSGVRGNLNSGGLNINTFSSLRLTPGVRIELGVGNQPLINTFRSALVQEVPERTNLPFTHILEFTATNQLQERIELEISVPMVIGRVHRTQYNFTRAPDERPGDRMIWRFNLNPNAVARVDFSYFSETKDNPMYPQFDYYSNGR